MTEIGTTPEYLREQQYKTAGNLSARQSIYAYQTPRVSLWPRMLEIANLGGTERILDVGCGNGLYLGALRNAGHAGPTFGMDLSRGMLDAAAVASPDARLLVGDAQQLPFPDASFDCLLAMHMLYHVPDRALAIAELRRVLRPGGVVFVMTNSTAHLHQYDDLVESAATTALGTSLRPMERSMRRFSLESGGNELQATFVSVELHTLDSEIFVTDVEPVVAYTRSLGTISTDSRFDPLVAEVERRVTEIIARDGGFAISARAGVFVCR